MKWHMTGTIYGVFNACGCVKTHWLDNPLILRSSTNIWYAITSEKKKVLSSIVGTPVHDHCHWTSLFPRAWIMLISKAWIRVRYLMWMTPWKKYGKVYMFFPTQVVTSFVQRHNLWIVTYLVTVHFFMLNISHIPIIIALIFDGKSSAFNGGSPIPGRSWGSQQQQNLQAARHQLNQPWAPWDVMMFMGLRDCPSKAVSRWFKPIIIYLLNWWWSEYPYEFTGSRLGLLFFSIAPTKGFTRPWAEGWSMFCSLKKWVILTVRVSLGDASMYYVQSLPFYFYTYIYIYQFYCIHSTSNNPINKNHLWSEYPVDILFSNRSYIYILTYIITYHNP